MNGIITASGRFRTFALALGLGSLLSVICGESAQADACKAAVDNYEAAHVPYLKKNAEYFRAPIPDDQKEFDAFNCGYLTWGWTSYLPFLQRELRIIEAACGEGLYKYYPKATYQGADYFTNVQPAKTRQALLEQCGIDANKLAVKSDSSSVPPLATAPPSGPSASTARPATSRHTCGSTITGGNFPPAPKEQCDKAKKWLGEARQARRSWFGGRAKAEPLYRQAAQIYKEAGDLRRAELANEEAAAEDVTIYERAERDAEERPKNLEEAEHTKDIARKIELGAYESRSCGDLLKASEYYFQAARLYLRADETDAVNALLLRRDQLQAIVDDAKRRGACDGKVVIQRTGGVPPKAPLPPDKCNTVLEQIEKVAKEDGRRAAALRIELYPQCPTVVKVGGGDCDRARLVWMYKDNVPIPTIKEKLKAANCKNWNFDAH